jgi:single-strand DNA-binding protein
LEKLVKLQKGKIMRDVNRVLLMGRLGAQPVVQKTERDHLRSVLSLATKGLNDQTLWHRVVVWGKQAEVCEKFLKKGSTIYVEGRLNNFAVGEGNEKKYFVEVVAEKVSFINTGKPGANQDLDQESESFPSAAIL